MRPRDLGASGSAEAPRLPLPAGRILPAPRSRPHCARASSAPLGSRVGGGHLPDPASGHRRCVPVCLTEGQGLRLLRSGLQRPLPCWVAGWAWGGAPSLPASLSSVLPSFSFPRSRPYRARGDGGEVRRGLGYSCPPPLLCDLRLVPCLLCVPGTPLKTKRLEWTI